MKEIIKDIITEFHKDDLPYIMPRQINLPQLPSNLRKALVFIGMRRVGKTFLMYQQMSHALANGLKKEQLLYINFEDDRLHGFSTKNFQQLLDVYYEMYPSMLNNSQCLLFLDEIQNIQGWEQFIRRLLDKESMSIFITGSSATLLSKEIASSLRGRCIEVEVFPCHFIEYLHHQGIKQLQHLKSQEKAVLKHHANTYLERGGFPEALDLPDGLHKTLLQSYVDAVVFRDVIERYQLKNPHIIKIFLLFCLQNISAPLSITKAYKTLKSRGEQVSRNSLYEYLSYFEDTFLICTVPIYDLSTRKRQVNPAKIYCIDTGIITAYSIKKSMEYAARLENAVYIHLRQLKYHDIFYHKTKTGKEIDFIAQKINGETIMVQVCVTLNDATTRERELSAIMEAQQELILQQAWIITLDQEETIQQDDFTIHVVPYWQWVIR